MADPAYALCTSTRVKQLLGVTGSTYDTQIEYIVGACALAAEKYCNRVFVTRNTTTTEYIDVPDSGVLDLFVAQPPISTITSLYEDVSRTYGAETALTDGTHYVFYGSQGRLRRLGGGWAPGEKSVKIAYTGGYANTAAIPLDLSEACASMCCYVWKQNKPHSGERIGIGSHSIEGQSVSYVQGAPQYIRDVYDRYVIGLVGIWP